MRKPVIGYLDSTSDYPATDDTANENCPICNKPLGYSVPLVCYGPDYIIHEHCKDKENQ